MSKKHQSAFADVNANFSNQSFLAAAKTFNFGYKRTITPQ